MGEERVGMGVLIGWGAAGDIEGNYGTVLK